MNKTNLLVNTLTLESNSTTSMQVLSERAAPGHPIVIERKYELSVHICYFKFFDTYLNYQTGSL